MITNHTFSGLVLRPPGLAAQGTTVDEPIYKALGDKMAAENGYSSQYGYQLYDTTGTTEDWSYNATGGLGYTFELGEPGFHPPFADTVVEWNGTTRRRHGRRQPRGLLRRPGEHGRRDQALGADRQGAGGGGAAPEEDVPDADLQRVDVHGHARQHAAGAVERRPSSGTSTPPRGRWSPRARAGRPTATRARRSQFASTKRTTPCANFDTPPPNCYEDHLIKVPSGTGIDNAKATFRIEWPTPASDYDMKVYKADAAGNATGDPLATSGNGATNGCSASRRRRSSIPPARTWCA